MDELLHRFWNDQQVQVFAFLIVADLAVGLLAAGKTKTFNLAYLSDFARNDLLYKALPALLLYGGMVYAAGADLVIPGLDMEVVARGAIGIAMAAMVGSLLGSVRDLGLLKEAADSLAGKDPNAKV